MPTKTIYKSPFPPVKQFSNKTAFQFLFENTSRLDLKKPAIIATETGKEISYGELIDQSLSFADGLRNIAGAAGVVCSMANAAYQPSELAHQLSESKARVILVGSEIVEVAKEAASSLGISEKQIYVLPGGDGKLVLAGLQSYEKLRGKKTFMPVTVDRNCPASRELRMPSFLFCGNELPGYSHLAFVFRSKPKGVVISHANITSVCLQLDNVKGLFDDPKDVILGSLPLSHVYGLVVLLYQTIHTGGTLALMSKFDLVQFCESVQKYKASIALVVPPICIGLVKHPIVDKYDLSSLRFLMSGAAPLSQSLQDQLQKRLRGNTIVTQGFGMTETTSIGLLPDLKDLKSGTCGKLFPSMEARLVDEDGQDVAEGDAGELWLRGPNIMVGYLNNEKATAESIDSEGWLKTGDVCELTKSEKDPSAQFYSIVDRRKELIKYKGFQVIPSELEAVLLTCDWVADAAVIGIWDEDQATELPRAYVVIEPKYANDEEICKKVGAFVSSKVAAHKRLRGGVVKVDVVPKSPSGKILRKELRVFAATHGSSSAKL